MLQFKNSLKILCVFQYLHLLENANYEQDDDVLIPHFSMTKKCSKTDTNQMLQEVV